MIDCDFLISTAFDSYTSYVTMWFIDQIKLYELLSPL